MVHSLHALRKEYIEEQKCPDDVRTQAQVGASLNGMFTSNPRLIVAGTTISFVPIVVVFAALQRYFFRGVEEGATEG
ncbi:hypothetical protein [Nonomuraea sp. NPDC050691]|uniref:hypothetical protein n=1 Tax=Nonomuraea sp. NPDC050691 TaxID=3155661 RepID=UPI0033D73AE6